MARYTDSLSIGVRRRKIYFAIGLLLTVLISVVDYYSGSAIPFLMLYFIPVVWLNWTVGWQAAMSVACLNVLIWIALANFTAGHPAPSWPPVWNALRGILYLGVAYILSTYKRMADLEKRWAFEDPLTGLANRRAFFQWAQKEITRARRYGTPVTVAVIDVDDFKQINDRWGHGQGDKVLVWIANTLRSNLRSADLVARLGGDELAVLLSDNTVEDAQAAMVKVHQSLKESAGELGLAVSVSIGVAAFSPAPITVDEMLRAADRHMYRVKKAGKDNLEFQVLKAELTI